MEDEEEYLDFYDFTRTYKNHPLLIENEMMIKEAGENEKTEGSDVGWEDCDLEDEEDNTYKEEEKDSGFQVIGESDGSESFKLIDKDGNTDDDDITVDSNGNKLNDFELRKGTGKTKDDVFLGLEIKKAKLLSTGEV